MLEDFAPEIPDYALDMHMMKGKAMGRGLDHFRKEGAKLVPEPTAPDPYIEEAYRLWAIKQQRASKPDQQHHVWDPWSADHAPMHPRGMLGVTAQANKPASSAGTAPGAA